MDEVDALRNEISDSKSRAHTVGGLHVTRRYYPGIAY